MPSGDDSHPPAPNGHGHGHGHAADVETKGLIPIKEDMSSLARGSSYSERGPPPPSVYREGLVPPRFLQSWADGFRRDPNQRISPLDPIHDILTAGAGSLRRPSLPRASGQHYFDMRMAALSTAQTSLLRRLKGRHLQMIAIGGSIGMWSPASAPRCIEAGIRFLGARPADPERHRSLRGLGPFPGHWGPRVASDRLPVHRRHALLHRPGARRAGRGLSRRRLLFGLLDALPRPQLGFLYGLEVCRAPPSFFCATYSGREPGS